MADQLTLEPHALQLESVWLKRAVVHRRARKDDEAEDQAVGQARVIRPTIPRGKVSLFSCRVDFSVVIPVLEGETFDAKLQVMASVAVDEPVPSADARWFCQTQVPFLVWPFARSFLAQFSSMTGVATPLLPLVVVPRFTPPDE